MREALKVYLAFAAVLYPVRLLRSIEMRLEMSTPFVHVIAAERSLV